LEFTKDELLHGHPDEGVNVAENEVVDQVGVVEVAAPIAARPSNLLCQIKFACEDAHKGLKVLSFVFGELELGVMPMTEEEIIANSDDNRNLFTKYKRQNF
jgi:hypothetical protein